LFIANPKLIPQWLVKIWGDSCRTGMKTGNAFPGRNKARDQLATMFENHLFVRGNLGRNSFGFWSVFCTLTVIVVIGIS
jgi:hypothetical protein